LGYATQTRFKDPDDAKLREDTAETAFRTLQEAIGERPKTVPGQPAEKNPRAVKRGSKGGKVGGKRRAEILSLDELKRIAQQGVAGRRKKAAARETPSDS
jgi:hypothetical protein